MSTETTPKNAAKEVLVRSISGPMCAQCGGSTGLIELNGKTVQVQPQMIAAPGDALIFWVHRCHEPTLEPKPRRKLR